MLVPFPLLLLTCVLNYAGGNAEELDSDDLEDDSIDDDADDDEDVDELNEGAAMPEGRSAKPGGETGAEDLGSLRRYMEEMDHELKDTNIGQTFCKPVSLTFLSSAFQITEQRLNSD